MDIKYMAGFEREQLEKINVYMLFVNKQNELTKIKQESIALNKSSLHKKNMQDFINKNKNYKFRELFIYSQDNHDNLFLDELKMDHNIPFSPSQKILHPLHSLIFILNTKKHKTKRIIRKKFITPLNIYTDLIQTIIGFRFLV